MIFVTVGTQLPFDRLVRVVDHWAMDNPDQEVFAQVADSSFVPSHISAKKFLNPSEFRQMCGTADIIISHAGIGSIMAALEFQKPIIVMPRQADLHEHRNDHQQGTAKRFADMGYILAAYSDAEMRALLNQHQSLVTTANLRARSPGDQGIFTTVRDFLAEAEMAHGHRKLPAPKRHHKAGSSRGMG